ncbi:hypothetical protein LCGC14_0373060 [marine sediment metagenome]|uniref:Uncharacterized protein n=1 Tax=marine sediment metagenome TaxID=412755 RepID=A0A0F9VRK7_9ZZZZ
MSHLSDSRIVDLSEWHPWFPWVPIKLTEGNFNERGKYRWLWTVERKLNMEMTYPGDARWDDGKGDFAGHVWEYRDMGNRIDDQLSMWPGGNDDEMSFA